MMVGRSGGCLPMLGVKFGVPICTQSLLDEHLGAVGHVMLLALLAASITLVKASIIRLVSGGISRQREWRSDGLDSETLVVLSHQQKMLSRQCSIFSNPIRGKNMLQQLEQDSFRSRS